MATSCDHLAARALSLLCMLSLLQSADTTEADNNSTIQVMRLEDIERKILREIGLTAPPAPFEIPEQVRQRALRKHVFSSSTDLPRSSHQTLEIVAYDSAPRGLPTAAFNFSRQTRQRDVVFAALSFHVRLPSGGKVDDDVDDDVITVHVHERMKDGELSPSIASRRFSLSAHDAREPLIIALDADDVQRWWTEKENVFAGLFVSAMFRGDNLAIHPQDNDSDMKNMLLAIKLMAAPSRTARQEEKKLPECVPGTCCKHDLFVDFKKIGWKFVLAPQRYNAFSCSGGCPKGGENKDVMTAQTLGRAPFEPAPCCHASKYESLEIIYITPEQEVVMLHVDGMVATDCKCG